MLNNSLKYEKLILVLSLALFGLFYEGTAGYIGIALLILFLSRLCREKKVVLPKSIFLLTLCALPVIALISSLWAIDWGLALEGAVKWFPLPMFVLLMGYETKESREELLSIVPYTSAGLVLASGILYFTPIGNTIFLNNRMMGTFQYANSFALLLMLGIMISLFNEKHSYKDFILILINITGILLTGCRAVFFLLTVGVITWLLYEIIISRKGKQNQKFANVKAENNAHLNRNNNEKQKITDESDDSKELRKSKQQGDKKFPIAVAGGFAGIVGTGVVLASVTGNIRLFARFTQFYAHSSTFVGRYLYLVDGLKLILKHPFGMGYRGYLFTQGSVQTANYMVTYAHNELLQAGLDYGILVMLVFLVGYLMVLFKRDICFRDRLVLALTGIHLLFDWDFQFVSLIFVVILFMGSECNKTVDIKSGISVFKVASCFMAVFVLWVGMAANFEALGKYEAATKIYPGATMSQMNLINVSDDKYKLAESICKRNDYCTVALQAMAERKAQEGDFMAMEEYADKALRSSRYNSDGYEIYITMMCYAANAYDQAGIADGVNYFMKKTADVGDIIDKVNEETNKNAKYLYDSSEIVLDDEYWKVIRDAKEMMHGI